jgi:hypothetical protein
VHRGAGRQAAREQYDRTGELIVGASNLLCMGLFFKKSGSVSPKALFPHDDAIFRRSDQAQ